MEDIDKIDRGFLDFIYRALKRGAAARNGGQLVTFVMRDTDGEAAPAEFVAEWTPESLEKAVQYVRSSPASTRMAVIVFDGSVDVNRQQVDAVIAECFMRGEKEGLIFAQRYQGSFQLATIDIVGIPTFIGTTANLL